jgi:hypothetical protein
MTLRFAALDCLRLHASESHLATGRGLAKRAGDYEPFVAADSSRRGFGQVGCSETCTQFRTANPVCPTVHFEEPGRVIGLLPG